MRSPSLVRSDPDFMERLTQAAASAEKVYPLSEHVEQQIYGAGFFSDSRPRNVQTVSLPPVGDSVWSNGSMISG